jgi:hypothetical protein
MPALLSADKHVSFEHSDTGRRVLKAMGLAWLEWREVCCASWRAVVVVGGCTTFLHWEVCVYSTIFWSLLVNYCSGMDGHKSYHLNTTKAVSTLFLGVLCMHTPTNFAHINIKPGSLATPEFFWNQ